MKISNFLTFAKLIFVVLPLIFLLGFYFSFLFYCVFSAEYGLVIFLGFYRLAQLFCFAPAGWCFSLLKPCAAQRLTQKLLLAFFALTLKKLSQNFCERYRYGAPRLAQRL